MGYDSEKKLVSKPIDTTDVAAALGVTSSDVGTLCCSEEINMMAKYKPVSYAKWGELTDRERDVITNDPASNTFFGIQITGTVNGVFDHTLKEFHNAKFTYIRPVGGAASPFRITDFDNYKHDARPNPHASFNIDSRDGEKLVAYFNDDDETYGSLSGIEVGYDINNIYGVDFTAMYSDGDGESGESLVNNLKRSYPCILITDESNGKSYFTALDFPAELGQKPVARPLYYNGSSVSSQNWSVRFGKPTYSNGVNTGVSDKPWNSFKDNLKATLFLTKSIDIYGPWLDASKTQNFSQYWMELSEGNSAYYGAARPIVLPSDIHGASLTLKRKGAANSYFVPTGVEFVSNTIKILTRLEGKLTESVTVECRVLVEGGTNAYKSPTTISPLLGTYTTIFTQNELGILFLPNDEYTINVTITTTDSEGTTSESGTFTFTAK